MNVDSGISLKVDQTHPETAKWQAVLQKIEHSNNRPPAHFSTVEHLLAFNGSVAHSFSLKNGPKQ